MGLYVLSYLLFVCVQFDIQVTSGALCAVMSVCLCIVSHPGSECGALRAVISVVCLCTV